MKKFVRSKIAVLALVVSVSPSLAGNLETAVFESTQTWRFSARLYACTATGWTNASTSRKQLSGFPVSIRETSPFQTIHVGYCGRTSTHEGPRPAVIFCCSLVRLQRRRSRAGSLWKSDLRKRQSGCQYCVSCAVCHGPNAEGIRQIPRLGGLSYYYLKQKLEQWGEGYHAAAEPPMPRIASKLSPNQIEALASYLSFVK